MCLNNVRDCNADRMQCAASRTIVVYIFHQARILVADADVIKVKLGNSPITCFVLAISPIHRLLQWMLRTTRLHFLAGLFMVCMEKGMV